MADDAPQVPAASPDTAATPECAVHAPRTASASCPRCGRFACAACLRQADGLSLCVECFARPEVRLTASLRARRALWLGLLGLHGALPLLPVALWLAREELAAIERGEAPVAGRQWAKGAQWAAAAGAVAWALVGLALWLR